MVSPTIEVGRTISSDVPGSQTSQAPSQRPRSTFKPFPSQCLRRMIAVFSAAWLSAAWATGSRRHLRQRLGGLFSDLFFRVVQKRERHGTDHLGVAPPIEITKIVGRVVSVPPSRSGLKPRYGREDHPIFLPAAIASLDFRAMMAVTAERGLAKNQGGSNGRRQHGAPSLPLANQDPTH